MAPFQKDERFFTKDWTITLPSHPDPNLKFKRLTPAETASFVRFAEEAVIPSAPPQSSSSNNSSPSTSSQAPAAALAPAPIPGERMQKMYHTSRTLHHALDVYISLNNVFVGWGGVFEISPPNPNPNSPKTPSIANIGIRIHPSVRGKGLGKLLMLVLLRLSNEVRADVVEAGTMGFNVEMRGLAKSVGLEETWERKVDGMGEVVAEAMFLDIPRERWRDLDMVVEFRDQVVSE